MGFAAQPTAAATIPLPYALGGVSMLINGVPTPLLYADSRQINLQIPFENQAGSALLMVRSPQGASLEYPLTIAAAVPGVFQMTGNWAVATDAAGALITPSHPAAPGSTIVVYLTGIGVLTTTPSDGSATPLSPLAWATLPFTATVGGMNAPVRFLGLTPGFVGLAQANLQVPLLSTGDYPLVITIGSAASAPALLAVQ
jgi:uncharacterized protein (TIGR03437 family)